MSKKIIIGGILIFIGVILLFVGAVFGLDANPQELYKHFPADADKRLKEIQFFQTLANIAGFLFGGIGLVVLLAGLIQKKPEKENSSAV